MRHLNKKTFTRPRNDVFEPSDTALCLGASHNMSPLNNRCVVITCFSNPQDHSVTRGNMDNCCPTLNAASGESGNNRPFFVRTHVGKRQLFGIDQQGGKGGANYTKEVAPTICSDSHGTPHGVAIINHEGKKERSTCSA